MNKRVQSSTALLVGALLVVPASLAKPAEVITVQVDWEEARSMLTEDSVRPPIQILLQSGKRLKGKLVEVSAAGA